MATGDLLVPTIQRIQFLRSIFAGIGAFRLGLFKEPYDPTVTDTIGTYQAIEANFSVYARQPCAIVSYNFDIDGNAVALGQILTWEVTFPGPAQNIYGFFGADATNKLLFAQRSVLGPVPMTLIGQQYRVAFQFSMGGME